MTDADVLKLRLFVQEICFRPRPIDDQPHTSKDGKMWCEDWEIIELCKYLFYGRTLYMGDPPPNRLKNNPLWSQEDIATKAEALLQQYGTADAIIAHLRKRRSGGAA